MNTIDLSSFTKEQIKLVFPSGFSIIAHPDVIERLLTDWVIQNKDKVSTHEQIHFT